MEDGHTIFDYNVGLNDIVQLLVRQTLPAAPLPKEKEAELSDSDSGCGSAQSESDKCSTHGEADGQTAGSSSNTDAPDLIDPGFGFYKVRLGLGLAVIRPLCTTSCSFGATWKLYLREAGEWRSVNPSHQTSVG